MISVIIPTFNNKIQLLQNLKHNLDFLKGNEIIVVNDDPEESLKNEKLFSTGSNNKIKLVENKQNLGFGPTVNIGVSFAKNKFIMLLNDDVKLINDNFLNALEYFKKDKNLFAVSFAQKEDNGSIVGKNIFYWKRGLFFHTKAFDSKFGPNAWAEGGASLIDKNKFLQLRGFDSIYSPFYWEDIDLSYRASQQGYKILFDPKILVRHQHESTIGKYFSKSFIKTIAYRNQFIFMWKNILNPLLIIQHLIFLPFNLLYYLLKGEKEFIIGFIKALMIKLHPQGGHLFRDNAHPESV